MSHFVHYAGIVLLVTLLVGLFARRRQGACLTFTLYVMAVLASTSLTAAWPQQFSRPDFWVFKENVHNLLKYFIALELGYRTFRAFPGARAAARSLILVVVALIGAMAASASTGFTAAGYLDLDWLARMLNGTIWLMTAVAFLILWYRLPVHPLHKAILVGFVPYLLLFSVCMKLVSERGAEARILHFVHPAVYTLLLVYWNHAVWRKSDVPVRPAPRRPEEQVQPVPGV